MKPHVAAALFFWAFCCAFSAVPAYGQASSPADVLGRLFAEGAEAAEYTDAFRAAVPLQRMQQILSGMVEQLGTFRSVTGSANPYTVHFRNGTATAYLRLDGEGRIAGLQFTRLSPAVADLDEAVSRLQALEEDVSFLVTENGRPLAAQRAGEPLAVGSAFKLAVLAAVREAVDGGGLRWDRVVGLQPAWKSLPGGILQSWPDGSALTVETLATLMISISDNTAADALIALVGRTAVEKYAPRSRPFLTTREAFVLKAPENRDLLRRYRAASEAGRRELLDELAGRGLPDPEFLAGGISAPDVEWFFSVEELCGLIERIADLPSFRVNPGLADPAEWREIAFKGGSEPGVLNLTTRLVSGDGTIYCVSLTQNRADELPDETQFFSAYQGVIDTLRDRR